jgi:hypothetical protein
MIPGSRTLRFLGALLLAACGTAVAQGGAAVITLVMPPPGGDGYSALQTGGAHPSGAAGLYYNPALLPELERATGSQLHFTSSAQNLLPALQEPDLRQEFWAAAAVLPLDRGLTAGVGFFRNHVSFGPNFGEDSGHMASEAVNALGAGLRLELPLPQNVLSFLRAGISAGGSIKQYDSRLSRGDDGRAYGLAFDLGLFADTRIFPLGGVAVRSLAADFFGGVAWQNLGPDVSYADPGQTDPLPEQRRTSLGLTVRFADAVEASLGRDWEHDTHRRAAADDPAVRTYGYSASILGYRKGKALLVDPSGGRREIHRSRSFEISLLQIHRLLQRVRLRDVTSASEKLDEGYLFGTTSVFGIPFRANPRFVIGERRIDGRDGGIRDGQKATYWSVAL